MKSNPGGNVAIEDIIGRDHLIAQLWDTLERTSVVMTAERRIGKTSIIRKMQAQPPEGWVPVLQDLEKIHTSDEFAVAVYEAILKFLNTRQKVAQKAKSFFGAIGGTEIAGLIRLPQNKDKHWKTLLTRSVEDLLLEQKPNRVVFFWDEMPYMLGSISQREGEESAMEILDVLRALRQGSSDFRMMLTGSIGLHHVLGSLKDAGYRNEPVNDMYDVEVTPLDRDDAIELARRLIRGEELKTSDLDRSAAAIADQGDCFPFYIHLIAKKLKLSSCSAEPDDVDKAVNEQLVSPSDPWELCHYRDRIKSYYPGNDRLVTAILDHLATHQNPQSVDAILKTVKAQIAAAVDREKLLSILKLLQRDHYLSRSTNGRYSIHFPLIGRWWKLDRGLT